jgi:hypothetical protein
MFQTVYTCDWLLLLRGEGIWSYLDALTTSEYITSPLYFMHHQNRDRLINTISVVLCYRYHYITLVQIDKQGSQVWQGKLERYLLVTWLRNIQTALYISDQFKRNMNGSEHATYVLKMRISISDLHLPCKLVQDSLKGRKLFQEHDRSQNS